MKVNSCQLLQFQLNLQSFTGHFCICQQQLASAVLALQAPQQQLLLRGGYFRVTHPLIFPKLVNGLTSVSFSSHGKRLLLLCIYSSDFCIDDIEYDE